MPPSRARTSWSAIKWIAAILAIAVHATFVLFLIFSVNWQNRKPEPVIAELYVPPAAEKIEPPKPPPPEPPKPEPPKPQVEAKPPPVEPPKPDIALKEKQERARKEQAERERKEKEKQAAERREVERREAEKKEQLEKRLAEARERQAREAEALKAQAQRERQAQEKIAAAGARVKADAAYIRPIQAKIRGNVVVPPDTPGNPGAILA